MAKNESEGVSRRDILGTGLTVATLAGTTGLVTGGTAVMIAQPDTAKADDDEDHHKKALIPPGKLDEYYGFWSGGQSGEMRILGLPSMRELMRIPVFNRCSAIGLGHHQREPPDHHRGPDARGASSSSKPRARRPISTATCTILARPSPTAPTTAGTCSSTTRRTRALARIRLDVMKCDKIIRNPERALDPRPAPAALSRAPAMSSATARTEAPMPNVGKMLDDPRILALRVHRRRRRYDASRLAGRSSRATSTTTMRTMRASGHRSTCYNAEEGITVADMTASDKDHVVVFNCGHREGRAGWQVPGDQRRQGS